MKRTDLLLKIIPAANGEPLTPAQLQKVAFLLGMEFADTLPADYYSFQKYDYGPFCIDIYRDAEKLQRDGLVNISANERGGWKEYSAADTAAFANLDAIPVRIARFIDDTVTWARNISFQELVRTIYIRYPEFKENSVFQG